jgi:DNA-binding response OmpR family regulator
MEDATTKKILIVDDDASILDLYSEILSSEGFKVSTASNVDEALQKAEGEMFDLVLLDIMLGDGLPSGIECLKIMKSNPEKYKRPIIVMLTNLAVTNNVKEAFDNGADGYLIKLTLSTDQIPAKVRGFLNGFASNK